MLGFQDLTENLVGLYLYGFHNHLERSVLDSYRCWCLGEIVWLKCGDKLVIVIVTFIFLKTKIMS